MKDNSRKPFLSRLLGGLFPLILGLSIGAALIFSEDHGYRAVAAVLYALVGALMSFLGGWLLYHLSRVLFEKKNIALYRVPVRRGTFLYYAVICNMILSGPVLFFAGLYAIYHAIAGSPV